LPILTDVIGLSIDTTTEFETAVHPLASVRVTKYVPGAFTLIAWVVSPLGDQTLPDEALEVSVRVDPEQI
jgi:hypothetical protein